MPPTIAQALATARLDAVDARVLLRHVCKVSDAYLVAHAQDALSVAQEGVFAALVKRRAVGEPVAYLTGTREFFSLEFKVTPAVLIPRPDTELLVEAALENIPAGSACSVLDLGTGSGCIAISIAKHRPLAQVVAVDRSAAALAVAHENAARHAAANVELKISDWFAALGDQSFDVIVANPPYVADGDPHLQRGDLRYEPGEALAASADGLECIRTIVANAPQHLNPGGFIALEHGYDQAVRCRELLIAAGLAKVFSRTDIGGIERVSGGRLS
ncbi:MAG: peptide chain release factor N(5)-glutamine methyltransferase [Burkholderiales bacterium]